MTEVLVGNKINRMHERSLRIRIVMVIINPVLKIASER